jgi:hypothetical protein
MMPNTVKIDTIGETSAKAKSESPLQRQLIIYPVFGDFGRSFLTVLHDKPPCQSEVGESVGART